MPRERLSAMQIVFLENRKMMAQNVSKLLAQEGEIVIIRNVHRKGGKIQLLKRGVNNVMLGLYRDIQELGFSIEEVKTILNSPAKPIALGPKKG